MVVDGGASVRVSRRFAFHRANSTGEVTLVRSYWHRKTRNENKGVYLERHTWQKQQNVYLSASTTPATRFRSSAGRFTSRCRTRKRSAPVISGSSTSPVKIICIPPSASSRQSYPFRPVAPSCAPPNDRFERSREYHVDRGSIVFGEPGRGSMIWIKQLRLSLAQPGVAQSHR